jgi:hypothetical protein
MGAGCGNAGIIFENCQFLGNGLRLTGANNIFVNSGVQQFIFRNCALDPTLFNYSYTPALYGSYAKMQRINGVIGNHETLTATGNLYIDTVLYATASPSLRMKPNNAALKLESSPPNEGMKYPVANGNTVTVNVKIRRSKSTDPSGANYNGNQPRLILRKNVCLGVASDTVLATGTGGLGNPWETLTATTPVATDDGCFELIVDCDGTTGWVNVDDWS